jgi:hypothetical protein
VAFILDLGDGTQGIVGVDTRYHERAKPEIPKPSNLAAVDTPACQWPVALGPLRRRPPRRQHRRRRGVRPLPGLLVDRATFACPTVEELLDAGALPTPTAATLRDRYLPG